MAVREGARAFVAPTVVVPEEFAVSAPALRGATAEPSASSGSLPLSALSVAVVGATAAKMTSRRRATNSRAQAVVRQAGYGVQIPTGTNTRVNDTKQLASLLTSVAAKVLESESLLMQSQAQLAEKEAALGRMQAETGALISAAEEAKKAAQAGAAAKQKVLQIMEESAMLHYQTVQQINKIATTGNSDLLQALDLNAGAAGGIGSITETEVRNALSEWGAGIVEIGTVFHRGGDYKSKAAEMIRRLYAFDLYPVLFKPTKASEHPFRPTFEGAFSYFVGGNPAFPEDHGFAIKPWTNVRIQPGSFSLNKDTATVMGEYWFTDLSGTETKVEFTFGYKKDTQGKLRVILHHSSLPYSH